VAVGRVFRETIVVDTDVLVFVSADIGILLRIESRSWIQSTQAGSSVDC
jgi:hypothetical protein